MTTFIAELDSTASEPLYKQLTLILKGRIERGELEKGSKLPSSRTLARDCGVSRIVTLAAYEQLIAEGYLVSHHGSGTFVSANVPTILAPPHSGYRGPEWFQKPTQNDSQVSEAQYDFSIGQPASNLFPEQSWRRAWRKSLSRSFTTVKPDPAGDPELRGALTRFLKRSRNITADAKNIVVTSGAAETLRLISKAMAEHRPVSFIESPGFGNAWRWLSGCGDTRPVAIDEQGLMMDFSLKETGRPSLLFTTPSHQFPLGFRLSLSRRNRLLAWAREKDALILEDDYDSEFHYENMALPTLKSQDTTGNILYFSSFSKSVSPNIKIGYMIGPKNICEAITQIISEEHAEPPYLMQNAMAHFIESGDLEKHIARSRRHYTRLNKIMRDKLADLPKGVRVCGLESGIHAFLSFETFPAQLIERLEEKSYHLPHQISENGWHGFAIGYGHFKEEKLCEALDELRNEIKQ